MTCLCNSCLLFPVSRSVVALLIHIHQQLELGVASTDIHVSHLFRSAVELQLIVQINNCQTREATDEWR